MQGYSIQSALTEHARSVWEINNAADVRAVSVNPEPIPWDEHLNWFEASLHSQDRYLYVVTKDDRTCGVIRFDRMESLDTFEVSIALAADSRGVGLGTRILASAFEYGPSEMNHIVAHVRPSNVASLRSFEKAAFELMETVKDGDVELLRLERHRKVAN